MKKIIATILGFAAVSVLVSTVFLTDAKAQILTQPPLGSTSLTKQISSPEALGHYLWKNFSYESDQSNFGKNDYWQTPEEFIANGKGDCEDFAVFASELLKQTGRKAFVLSIYGDGYAHTICVFMENGRYQAIDETEVKRVNASDLQSLMSSIYPYWNKGAIVALSTATHKGVILKRIAK